MARAARPRVRSTSRRRPVRLRPIVRARIVPGSVPPEAILPPPEREPPHAHAVCRSCGRIADVPMSAEERGFLDALSDGRPDGWKIRGITFSLTGFCPRCRGDRSR